MVAPFFVGSRDNGENMKEQICLCHRCAAEYRQANIKIQRDYKEIYMDKCDKCERCGWWYLIEREKDGRKNTGNKKAKQDSSDVNTDTMPKTSG